MEILVFSKRRSIEKINLEYPNAQIIDVTSKSKDDFIKFSPFYPHGDIPVPYSTNCFAQSVEGIWQGLKVFKSEGIDISKFEVSNMKNIKRTVRRLGMVLGHQKGIDSNELLDYYQARIKIYLPTYQWVLDNKLQNQISYLNNTSSTQQIILLDYETNIDISNTSKPLSHAGLIKNYLENNFSLKY